MILHQKYRKPVLSTIVSAFLAGMQLASAQNLQFGGIYPHLAQYNQEGECGTGAVVAWADRLWTISYGPHLPFGSTDKLYEIKPDLTRTVRVESVGGTHANRLIHRESAQLFIGYHAINQNGQVRTIDPQKMPGRLTGIARSLTDPANKILYATMEEGFYEVDVHTLEVKTLFKDGNQMKLEGANGHESALLPGAHGKGFYSGQGVYVYSNNGEAGEKAKVDPTIEAGSLCEWDGQTWKVIRRNQFVEVTGPGGIYGNAHPQTDPIWTSGWDHRSALVGVRHDGRWCFFRLPKASNTYDGAHGWNTEWPRIRNIGTATAQDYLMTLHGMFWRFPKAFRPGHTAGIRPRSSYLKIIGDFERWNDRLVMGCDDATKNDFLSKRAEKAGLSGAGQSHSNLWFQELSMPDGNGPIDAFGSIYLRDTVLAGAVSEPFLFAGWSQRTAWIKNHGAAQVTISIEMDRDGQDQWQVAQQFTLLPGASYLLPFAKDEKGEWLRIKTSAKTVLSFSLAYADEKNKRNALPGLFSGLKYLLDPQPTSGVLYALGQSRQLGFLSNEGRYYQMDSLMQIKEVPDPEQKEWMAQHIAIPQPSIKLEGISYLAIDPQGKRWRLPMLPLDQAHLLPTIPSRVIREVVTERDLMHLGGTFYELPAENAGGYAKIRPIASHFYHVHDFATYRGLLILSGVNPAAANDNERVLVDPAGKIAVWAGAIDELWKLGKPKGLGGPWSEEVTAPGAVSDPYLLGGYDERRLIIVNHGKRKISLKLQIDPTGTGEWYDVQTFVVAGRKSRNTLFPAAWQGKWLRFVSLSGGVVTTQLEYY